MGEMGMSIQGHLQVPRKERAIGRAGWIKRRCFKDLRSIHFRSDLSQAVAIFPRRRPGKPRGSFLLRLSRATAMGGVWPIVFKHRGVIRADGEGEDIGSRELR